MRSLKKFSQWIEKPVTQELDQSDWISLRDNKVNIRPKEIPLLTTTKDAVYFDKDLELPNKLFLVSNSEGRLLENVNDKTVKLNTPSILDVFKDKSCIITYPFDGNANDLSGNYNGVWNGNEQYDAGKYGQAAKFDGESYIDTGYKTYELVNNKSFSLWIKADPSVNNDHVEFFGYRNADNRSSLSLFWYKSENRLELVSSGGADYYCVKYTGINDIITDWTHICGIYEDGRQTLYINGVRIGSSDLGQEGTEDYNIYIGWTGNNDKLVGLIDQVRIFNRPLTEDEVKILYAEQSKKLDVSGLNFISNVNKAFLGTDVYMTLGTGYDNNTELNKLRRYLKIDLENTDLTKNRLAVFEDLESEPVVNIDGDLIKPKIMDKVYTTNVLDLFKDDSCLATYTFDDRTANDLSSRHNGTWTGDEQYEAGVFDGLAAKFTHSYIRLENLGNLLGDNFTISLWYFVDDIINSESAIFDQSDGGDSGFSIRSFGENTIACAVAKGGNRNWISVENIPNKWNHVIMSYDGTNLKMWYNGKLIDSIEAGYEVANYNTNIGRQEEGDRFYFSGLVDQVRVFTRPITEDEAYRLYHEQRNILDTTSLNLTALPKQIYLPYKRTLEVINVDDTKVTVMENPKPGNNIKVLLDDEVVDVIDVEVEDTARTADLLGDGTNIATYTFDNETADDLNNNYNGTWNGNEQYDVGVFSGLAAKFDGESYIEIPIDPSNFAGSNPFTISTFFMFEKFDDFWSRVIDFGAHLLIGHAADTNYLGIHHRKNDDYSGTGIIDDKTDFKVTLEANRIYHLVLTYDGEKYGLWLDGKKLPITTRSLDESTPSITDKSFIGKSTYDADGLTHGTVDQVRIFNRALTEEEVRALFTEGKQVLELSKSVTSAITKIEILNDSISLLPLDYKPVKVTPASSDETVDAVEVTFKDFTDPAGYRAVQRGLVIEEPEVEIIEPFVSNVTRKQS